MGNHSIPKYKAGHTKSLWPVLILGGGGGQLRRYIDSLRTGRSGDRIPVKASFSAPVQTGPGAHPASYTMGTGSFPGVKRPGRGVDHPPPSSAEVEGRVELYLCSPSGSSWPVGYGDLYLYLININTLNSVQTPLHSAHKNSCHNLSLFPPLHNQSTSTSLHLLHFSTLFPVSSLSLPL